MPVDSGENTTTPESNDEQTDEAVSSLGSPESNNTESRTTRDVEAAEAVAVATEAAEAAVEAQEEVENGNAEAALEEMVDEAEAAVSQEDDE